MSSVKNLFVIVMLMGVSYGAFQVINAPDPLLENGDQTAESLDLQTTPRIDTGDALVDTPPSMSPDAFVETVPKLPPMSPDELTVPELDMPELEIGPAQPLKDPQALSDNAMPSAPPTTDMTSSGFEPPRLVPPSEPSAPPSNGGQFVAQPQTEMQPVTPPEFANQAVDQMQDFARQQTNSLEQATSGFAAQGNNLAETEIMQPARDASDMLDQSRTDVSNRADQMVNDIQDQYGQAVADAGQFMADSAASFTPPEAAPTSTPPAAAPENVPSAEIDWNGINELASSGQPRMALAKLSEHYQAQLPQDQRLQMLEWLDLLAGKVIYSTEHHLQTRPYVITENDTLESLGTSWQVPPQLIYNVNRSKIGDPANLVPGTELKVIEGPFNAVVNLQRQEMTLFLAGMYAGRFPVELGEDGGGIEHGDFMVRQKQPGKDYVDPSGQTIAAGTGDNPYGRFWIELGENLGIHEANPQGGPGDRRGSIRLGSRDAQDVFGILSNGSQVTITR